VPWALEGAACAATLPLTPRRLSEFIRHVEWCRVLPFHAPPAARAPFAAVSVGLGGDRAHRARSAKQVERVEESEGPQKAGALRLLRALNDIKREAALHQKKNSRLVVSWCRGVVVSWCRGVVVSWCRGVVVWGGGDKIVDSGKVCGKLCGKF